MSECARASNFLIRAGSPTLKLMSIYLYHKDHINKYFQERVNLLARRPENSARTLRDRITRRHVEINWIQSIGDGEGMHFREPPPGTRHAICKPGAKYCRVHKDEWNPHAGPLDAIAHALLEWTGAPLLIAGLILLALLTSSHGEVLYPCPACGAAMTVSPLRGFYNQCQACKNWFYAP